MLTFQPPVVLYFLFLRLFPNSCSLTGPFPFHGLTFPRPFSLPTPPPLLPICLLLKSVFVDKLALSFLLSVPFLPSRSIYSQEPTRSAPLSTRCRNLSFVGTPSVDVSLPFPSSRPLSLKDYRCPHDHFGLRNGTDILYDRCDPLIPCFNGSLCILPQKDPSRT